VAVLLTLETTDVAGSLVGAPFGVSGFVDNLLFIRFTESGGRVKRLVSVTKMRDSDYEAGLHLLEFRADGLHVGGLYAMDGDVIPRAHAMTGRGAGPADGRSE
jgi:circadian clock protein KaiC